MSDSAQDLLVRGIAAAKAKESSEARRYLEWALRMDANHEQCLKALFWLSEVSDDLQEKRRYLTEILAAEPNDPIAIRKLAILDGRLAAEEVIDPDRLPGEAATISQQAGDAAQCFVCPQCGGRLTYAPDGRTLTCEYCEARRGIAAQRPFLAQDNQDQNIAITMATLKGHVRPTAGKEVTCQACGASFALDADDLSAACPYCASIYVVTPTETRQLFDVDAVLPFTVSRRQALESAAAWLSSQRSTLRQTSLQINGFYLPAWLFSVSAPYPMRNSRSAASSYPKAPGRYTAVYEKILVPANRDWPPAWIPELERFDLVQLQPFDPAYLADWPAETYQVPLSDASLAARLQALQRVRAERPKDSFELFLDSERITSMDLVIEAYKLILLPFWCADCRFQGKRYAILINGQNSFTAGAPARRQLARWLDRRQQLLSR
ncbi:MAG: hypothetical protein AB1894_14320 [Chloroflexota bacterium]